TNAPPRKYYAHAAKRLADLVDSIRNKYPKDTVTIISHSQGTMVAMAAVAIARNVPDALFVLNSPYALDHNDLNGASLPADECISPEGRQNTLSAIIDKVASRKNHLSSLGYEGLCVGQTADKKNWRPDVALASESGSSLAERDNHGRTYIYFCPHDRVMGSRPLRSIGWQGLPNNSQGQPHPLLKKHQGNLFQRMLARSTPCGEAPNPATPFAKLPDGKPFWDDKGDKYQSSSFTYPDPPEWQTVFINAEKVPEPIDAAKLANFDVSRVGAEHDDRQIDGWGEINPDKNLKNDNTYDNYINLYPNQDIVIGFKNVGTESEPRMVPVTRKETFEEKDLRIRTYVSQPTDHSTLPMRADFMSQVVAYDLPIGYCDATWDKEFMADLRRKADWTQGEDPYLSSGEPDKVPEPDLISQDTVVDEFYKEQSKLPAYRAVNKA
ncbi:T6SS effector phospholipase Tle3 domain-containing protein, partial [Enterobacter hormaechei]|uniref:T6SS effector phospholipase Tle3 domain-containing protein n=3 Tax=Enterobacteriaceae TaxID=543 RepID=UPI00066836DE